MNSTQPDPGDTITMVSSNLIKQSLLTMWSVLLPMVATFQFFTQNGVLPFASSVYFTVMSSLAAGQDYVFYILDDPEYFLHRFHKMVLMSQPAYRKQYFALWDLKFLVEEHPTIFKDALPGILFAVFASILVLFTYIAMSMWLIRKLRNVLLPNKQAGKTTTKDKKLYQDVKSQLKAPETALDSLLGTPLKTSSESLMDAGSTLDQQKILQLILTYVQSTNNVVTVVEQNNRLLKNEIQNLMAKSPSALPKSGNDKPYLEQSTNDQACQTENSIQPDDKDDHTKIKAPYVNTAVQTDSSVQTSHAGTQIDADLQASDITVQSNSSIQTSDAITQTDLKAPVETSDASTQIDLKIETAKIETAEMSTQTDQFVQTSDACSQTITIGTTEMSTQTDESAQTSDACTQSEFKLHTKDMTTQTDSPVQTCDAGIQVELKSETANSTTQTEFAVPTCDVGIQVGFNIQTTEAGVQTDSIAQTCEVRIQTVMEVPPIDTPIQTANLAVQTDLPAKLCSRCSGSDEIDTPVDFAVEGDIQEAKSSELEGSLVDPIELLDMASDIQLPISRRSSFALPIELPESLASSARSTSGSSVTGPPSEGYSPEDPYYDGEGSYESGSEDEQMRDAWSERSEESDSQEEQTSEEIAARKILMPKSRKLMQVQLQTASAASVPQKGPLFPDMNSVFKGPVFNFRKTQDRDLDLGVGQPSNPPKFQLKAFAPFNMSTRDEETLGKGTSSRLPTLEEVQKVRPKADKFWVGFNRAAELSSSISATAQPGNLWAQNSAREGNPFAFVPVGAPADQSELGANTQQIGKVEPSEAHKFNATSEVRETVEINRETNATGCVPLVSEAGTSLPEKLGEASQQAEVGESADSNRSEEAAPSASEGTQVEGVAVQGAGGRTPEAAAKAAAKKAKNKEKKQRKKERARQLAGAK